MRIISFLRAILAAALALAVFGVDAHASIVVSIQEVGVDVVATASGSVDTTGLDFLGGTPGGAGVTPLLSRITVGTGSEVVLYAGLTGPSSFGLGFGAPASSATGPFFHVNGAFGYIGLPIGYVSGDSLSSTATFAAHSFDSLGLEPGTYVFTLPSSDTVTVQIAAAAVPEPSSVIMLGLGGLGVLGLGLRRRKTA